MYEHGINVVTATTPKFSAHSPFARCIQTFRLDLQCNQIIKFRLIVEHFPCADLHYISFVLKCVQLSIAMLHILQCAVLLNSSKL